MLSGSATPAYRSVHLPGSSLSREMEVMRGLQSEEGHFEEESRGKVDTFRLLFVFTSRFCLGQKTLKITDSPHSDFKKASLQHSLF